MWEKIKQSMSNLKSDFMASVRDIKRGWNQLSKSEKTKVILGYSAFAVGVITSWALMTFGVLTLPFGGVAAAYVGFLIQFAVGAALGVAAVKLHNMVEKHLENKQEFNYPSETGKNESSYVKAGGHLGDEHMLDSSPETGKNQNSLGHSSALSYSHATSAHSFWPNNGIIITQEKSLAQRLIQFLR